MSNTEDRSRRLEDQLPSEPLQWDTKQPLIDAALAHLAQEHFAAGVIPVPHTNPQQFIAIGSAIEIGGQLPEGFGTSAAGQAAGAVRALLLELTTFDSKMVSGNVLAQRAHAILALQQAAAQEEADKPSADEQYRPGFEAWFDVEYPKNEDGNREKYRNRMVMDLMLSAWTASKREASTEPSAGSPQEALANVVHTLQITTDWSRLNQSQIISRLREVAGALTDDAKDAALTLPARPTEAMRNAVYMALHYDMSVQNPDEWGATDKAIAALYAAIEAHTKAGKTLTVAETMDHDQLGKLGRYYENVK